MRKGRYIGFLILVVMLIEIFMPIIVIAAPIEDTSEGETNIKTAIEEKDKDSDTEKVTEENEAVSENEEDTSIEENNSSNEGEVSIYDESHENNKFTSADDIVEENENINQVAKSDSIDKEDDLDKKKIQSYTASEENSEMQSYAVSQENSEASSIAETDEFVEILEIYTIDDLVAFQKSVNNGNITYEGKIVKLMNDISFDGSNSYVDITLKDSLTSGRGFRPIGSTTSSFKGTFDGQGFEIEYLYMKIEEDIGGLFGCVQDGVIKNLTISGNIFIENKNSDVLSYYGALVGVCSNTIIENCNNKCTIKNRTTSFSGFCGGIAGNLDNSNIKNCSNIGNIDFAEVPAQSPSIGGIVGFSYIQGNTIVNCKNNGSISVVTENYYTIGGIVAVASKIDIIDCYNAGKIGLKYSIDNSKYIDGTIGGIAGSIDMVNIEKCYNLGNITIENNTNRTFNFDCDIGGIVGRSNIGKGYSITKCFNKGNISGNMKSTAGGIIGISGKQTNQQIEICECYNSGDINLQYASIVGGIVGICRVQSQTEGREIINCYNDGNINSANTDGIAGIVGMLRTSYTEALIIKNCYNIGYINGDSKSSFYFGRNSC